MDGAWDVDTTGGKDDCEVEVVGIGLDVIVFGSAELIESGLIIL